jgi:uncharacterized LabA/DUF88 family protein
MSQQRAIAYIDGYNLYHGLRDSRLTTSRWLDLVALSESLLKPDQHLKAVRYFTTRVRNDPATAARQSTYLDALKARGGVEIIYGHFLSKSVKCFSCQNTWQTHEEKKTDVNIAVRLLEDGYDDLYDLAVVVSGDSDLAPPIAAVQRRHAAKRVVVAFPPKRHSRELSTQASAAFTISPAKIRSSRLPTPLITTHGVALHAPAGWLPTT